jgi:hypothetical protein
MQACSAHMESNAAGVICVQTVLDAFILAKANVGSRLVSPNLHTFKASLAHELQRECIQTYSHKSTILTDGYHFIFFSDVKDVHI